MRSISEFIVERVRFFEVFIKSNKNIHQRSKEPVRANSFLDKSRLYKILEFEEHEYFTFHTIPYSLISERPMMKGLIVSLVY